MKTAKKLIFFFFFFGLKGLYTVEKTNLGCIFLYEDVENFQV